MNFDWDEFKIKKIAVHTKTQEEYDDFVKQAKENGLEFCLKGYNYFPRYKFKTCINYYYSYYCVHSQLSYCDIDYYKKKNYKIIEWGDYMNKELKKEDLKVGYVVKFNDGVLGMVAPVVKDNGENDLIIRFNDSVYHYTYITYDTLLSINKVYGYSANARAPFSISATFRELLWKREKPVKEVTMTEIEEKFGCKVKIVKEK